MEGHEKISFCDLSCCTLHSTVEVYCVRSALVEGIVGNGWYGQSSVHCTKCLERVTSTAKRLIQYYLKWKQGSIYGLWPIFVLMQQKLCQRASPIFWSDIDELLLQGHIALICAQETTSDLTRKLRYRQKLVITCAYDGERSTCWSCTPFIDIHPVLARTKKWMTSFLLKSLAFQGASGPLGMWLKFFLVKMV